MRLKFYINKALHLLEVMRVITNNKVVYLTFDDGPDPDITEFVLDALRRYDFEATFFCCGKNAELHPELLEKIKSEGHTIGNHTYSHIHGFETPAKVYVNDVQRANQILNAKYFRPPHGAVTLGEFIRLFCKYRIVYWNQPSGDHMESSFDLCENLIRLKKTTQKGDVVLFHFCHRHENETRQLLPLYLEWLESEGYKSIAL